MSRNIAIVEDDADQRENYSDALIGQGYVVQTYANKHDALRGFSEVLPDLAILDIMLEDEMDGGFDICRVLRQKSPKMPIIFLTARDSDIDRVSGLRLDAWDYITKPVNLQFLAVRVSSLFRIASSVQNKSEEPAILASQYLLIRNLTLVTILVFLFVLLSLFIFAWRLTVRIRRLSNTTERAITAEGRVLEEQIPSQVYPADELGNLGRSIARMLKRLSGYTRYLEGMPDTLAHELNNPLNVVSSSLEILETDVPNINQNKHMQRARNGVNRLRLILTNLTEAANLEEAMRNEIKEPVNLPELIAEFVDGYRGSHPQYEFLLQVKKSPLVVDCSPDHLAQMLDKLIDNAVQFSKPATPIIIRIASNKNHAEISVLNEGPKLPEKIIDRLFDPMVSYGKTNAKHSHLGLGLFVVRLIAEYHQGTAWAENRPHNQGVAVTVSMPVKRTTTH